MALRKLVLSTVVGVSVLACDREKPEPVSPMQCVPAKYVTNYCPTKKPTHLVRFLRPSRYATQLDTNNNGGIVYMAAVIDLPEKLQKRDTVFQLQFHYDPAVERGNLPVYCNTNLMPTKMVIYDGTRSTECHE